VYSTLPGGTNYPGDYAPILTDIAKCNLPQVSWVIPDGNWSDHPGQGNSPGDGGPSWVAAIVNAIGNSHANSGGHCDYLGNYAWPSEPTVILVVWDDWGGWYDDVPPPDCNTQTGACAGYFNGANHNGQQYVYGFRVPMLVIGAYTKQTTNGVDGFTGYISGPPSNPNCQNTNYCHDFGSILNFIEYAFGTGGNFLTLPGAQTWGISGQTSWGYADYLAMDVKPNCTSCTYSLSDFFNFQANPHAFQTINGAKYSPSCFHIPNQPFCFPDSYPQDPDDDAEETD
jgi:Phosphoesterase family